jgi:hypothetical protein
MARMCQEGAQFGYGLALDFIRPVRETAAIAGLLLLQNRNSFNLNQKIFTGQGGHTNPGAGRQMFCWEEVEQCFTHRQGIVDVVTHDIQTQGRDVSPTPTGSPDDNLDVLQRSARLNSEIGGAGDLLGCVPGHLAGYVQGSFAERGDSLGETILLA